MRLPNVKNARFGFLLLFVAAIVSAAVCRSQLLSAQAPINYLKSNPDDPIARLQKQIDAGKVSLRFDKRHGYLPAVLSALNVPQSSQTLVFSKTSFQREAISPWSPRALYFNNDVYIGWVQNGPVLEVASVDKELGTIFYTLDQEEIDKPHFRRQSVSCLQCHEGSMTGSVPGLVLRSTFPTADGTPMLNVPNYLTTAASPFEERWGGWYVTGMQGSMRHMGNLVIHADESPTRANLSLGANITDLSAKFETERYLSGGSDIVALLVFAHQAQVHNLLTQANYQARLALRDEASTPAKPAKESAESAAAIDKRIKGACEPLVHELLFCGETPLPNRITGSSTFTRDFPATGPRDKKSRSLRELDLTTRLFKYPCSYLIYTESFAALPAPAKEFIFQRLWDILNGKDTSSDFKHLTPADRTAILEILGDTLNGLPSYWKHNPSGG